VAQSPTNLPAPWTPEQVAALNLFQTESGMHPFTCPGGRLLTATPDGWQCSHCPYTQQWAIPFMAQPDTWPGKRTPHKETTVAHPLRMTDLPPSMRDTYPYVQGDRITFLLDGETTHVTGEVTHVILPSDRAVDGATLSVILDDNDDWADPLEDDESVTVHSGTVVSILPGARPKYTPEDLRDGARVDITINEYRTAHGTVVGHAVMHGHPVVLLTEAHGNGTQPQSWCHLRQVTRAI
jgi:hypothetical protein